MMDGHKERSKELVHAGGYLAEVEVEWIFDADPTKGWGPYLSLQDTLKLDRVRQALKEGDVKAAAREAVVYEARRLEPSRHAAE